MFSSIDEVIERFAKHNYIASRRIATVIYLASALQKPVLVEGPAGVGKTDLGKVLAASQDHELIRLQCYEGLDEGKALYEWEYAKQLPLVILTSNNAREMSDALKRRCLHLYIDFPTRDQELAIVKLKVPEAAEKLAEDLVAVVQSLRKLDLKKTPGISETLDWVKALTLLNVQNLDSALVDETLDTIVKYEGDVRKAQDELKEYMRRVRARRGGGTETKESSDKDMLN